MAIFTRKLISKSYLTNDVFEMVFERGDFDFKAGQFITINMPVDGEIIARSYSIVSSPYETNFLLCIKVVQNGKGSNYLANLQVGDEINFEGPLGSFVIADEIKNDLVFISTGVGVTPFVSMILDLIHKKDQRKISLYFGLRHKEDIFYADLLNNLAQKNDNFEFFLTLSQPPEPYNGLKGRVTEHFDDLDLAGSHFYICGNGDSVKSIYTALKEKGVPRQNLHIEQFTPINSAH